MVFVLLRVRVFNTNRISGMDCSMLLVIIETFFFEILCVFVVPCVSQFSAFLSSMCFDGRSS